MLRSPEFLAAALILLSTTCGAGCKTIQPAPPDFSALTTQASYQAPVVEKKVPPSGPMGPVQAVATRTVQCVAGAFVWVGCKMFESWLDDDDEKGFDPNPLWHQGYGFNNPNNERIRNGQPVLNFDGSVAK